MLLKSTINACNHCCFHFKVSTGQLSLDEEMTGLFFPGWAFHIDLNPTRLMYCGILSTELLTLRVSAELLRQCCYLSVQGILIRQKNNGSDWVHSSMGVGLQWCFFLIDDIWPVGLHKCLNVILISVWKQRTVHKLIRTVQLNRGNRKETWEST